MENQKKSITVINMNELKMMNNDIKEIFDDNELDIGRVLKKLAESFGASATLKQVYDIFTTYKLPTREVDGKSYVAGYKGLGRITDGWYNATLIDVKQSGKECKLMFAIDNKFLYQTLDEFTLNEVVSYAKDIGTTMFRVLVITEKIPNTGEHHSTINKSERYCREDIKP